MHTFTQSPVSVSPLTSGCAVSVIVVWPGVDGGGVSAHACPVKLVRRVLGIAAQVAVLKVATDRRWAGAVIEGNVIEGHVTEVACSQDALKDDQGLGGHVLAEEDCGALPLVALVTCLCPGGVA